MLFNWKMTGIEHIVQSFSPFQFAILCLNAPLIYLGSRCYPSLRE
jgi:uncharacterized membrane-anchored protein YitT (DUF2179 family)